MLYDAEMPVSSTLWDKIEQRIDTKPDKPKYWMIFLLAAIAIPALYLSSIGTHKNITISESNDSYTANTTTNKKPLQQRTNNLYEVKNNNSYLSDNRTTNTPSSPSASKVTEAAGSDLMAQISITKQEIGSVNNSLFATNGIDKEPVYDSPLKSVLLKFGSVDKPATIESLKSKNIESSSDSGDERPFIQRLFSPATRCPRFSNKLKGLYGWADYTSAYAKQNLSNNNSEYDGYINLRNSSERSVYSFSTSIGMGYIHASGWFLESGLTYDQINTQFHQTEENIIGTDEIIRTTKDENGNITDTYTEIIPIIGYNEIKHINKLTQIEVPLLIGYEMPVSPSINVSVKAGPNFNISSQSSGRVLDFEGNPIYFGDDSGANLYRNRLGIGYVAGAHIIKNITDKFAINLGVTYKSYGETQYETNPLSQSFSKYGLSSGIRYRFL